MSEIRGASMSTSQMTYAALDTRRVTAHIMPEFTIEGYLAGMDDFHWLIVDTDGGLTLVHKSAPVVRIARGSTYDEETEAARCLMDPILQPFIKSLQRMRGRDAA